MSIITEIFGKEIDELSIEDITNHFSQNKDESETVEYKSYFIHHQNNHNLKAKAVLKTICAFLNSNGGLLIWGAPIEQNDEEGKKYYAGDLSPIGRLIAKDNFISKITNNIVPAPAGIKIKVIATGDNDDCIVIFDIPESNYKPHRFDGRYYMRLDGQSKVGPHHYVEALFKQVKYPNLEGYIKFESIQRWSQNRLDLIGFYPNREYIKLQIRTFIFNFSGLINEEKPNFKIFSNPGKFTLYSTPGNQQYYQTDGHEYLNQNPKEVLHYGEPLSEIHFILIDPSDLEDRNNEIDLWLVFGGLKSPQKRSSYKLDLSNIEVENINNLVIETHENVTNFDLSQSLGQTRENILREILER